MSAATAPALVDREFYRVFLFLSWETHESSADTAERLRRLDGELHWLRWMPADQKIPDRAELADWMWILWESNVELADDWSKKLYGISFPEVLVTYVGLRRPALASTSASAAEAWDAWIPTALERWKETFPVDYRDRTFADASRVDPGGRPRILGEALLWTGEWSAMPSEGWESFAKAHYKPGCARVFDWGVLGFIEPDPSRGPGQPPRFDLHTTVEANQARGRDRYLLWDLPHLFVSFLKADQFLRHRFENGLRSRLEQTEAALLTPPADRPARWNENALQRAHREIKTTSDRLHALIEVLSAVEVDAQSVELAKTEVRRLLPSGDGPPPWPVATLDLLARQMQSDVEYARKTEKLAECLLDKHKTLGALEETRATDRLAKIGMIVGAGVGGMQLTGCVAYRALIFLASAALCLFVYRTELRETWDRLPNRAATPTNPPTS